MNNENNFMGTVEVDEKPKANKPQGVQYEKNANKKVQKQKISKKHNNRKQYADFKS